MEFKTDVNSLDVKDKFKIDLIGTKLPNSNDVFFRTKQKELVEQYTAARLFLKETETDDWNHWIENQNTTNTTNITRGFQLKFRSYFYEAALFYYNAVVDNSWTLCYVAMEFSCKNKDGGRADITGIQTIEKAVTFLREIEKNVTNPTAANNPFIYLKLICPEYNNIIDQIVEFWNKFNQSEIRNKYNFCKHKGRPSYEEIERLEIKTPIAIYISDQDGGQSTRVVSAPQDVRYSCSLENSIKELIDFDDNILFPYIQNLISSIEKVLQPSPLVF